MHLVGPIRLRAAFLEIAEEFTARFHRNAKCALRENHHPVSKISELSKRKQRALTKFSHVRQQWRFHLVREIAKLLRALQGLGKNRIRASVQIFVRAFDRAAEIFHRAGVRPRDDHEIWITARCDRRFDFADHLLKIDNRFPGDMSAALGEFLVFNVTTGQTDVL